MKGFAKLIVISTLFWPSAAQADELSNNFSSHLNETDLDALAKDIGALMGGGSFHTGKACSFPFGFDLGAHVPMVKVQDDNKIFRDDGSTMISTWGQAEVGLPGRINLIGRVGELAGARLYGGGLRVGLLTPSAPGLPAVSIAGLYDHLDHDIVESNTYTANLALSFDLKFIRPYVGAGYDYTELEPTAQAFSAAGPSVSRLLKGEASGYRAEAGINITVIPFTYLTAAAGLANGKSMMHVGAGVSF